MDHKKAIVVGATSGIGRALAKVLAAEGYSVGITGRREHLLESLAAELPTPSHRRVFDVSADNAIAEMDHLIGEMSAVDLIVVNAGTGAIDPELKWSGEKRTIDTNVLGFAAVCNAAWHYFRQRQTGHLVGISSIAALRGGRAPAYNASKAFVSNYLQGLRYLSEKSGLGITVTDIKPGFVDTAMAQGDDVFWSAPPEKAARQIYATIKAKKKHAYITRRWRLIAWLLKLLPDAVYNKI